MKKMSSKEILKKVLEHRKASQSVDEIDRWKLNHFVTAYRRSNGSWWLEVIEGDKSRHIKITPNLAYDLIIERIVDKEDFSLLQLTLLKNKHNCYMRINPPSYWVDRIRYP